MKVLSISTDRKIFEKDSDVRQRALEQSKLVEELVIIVVSLKQHHLEEFKQVKLRVIPTDSINSIYALFDAHKISEGLTGIDLVTAQDPFEIGLCAIFIKRTLGCPLQLQAHTDFLSPYFRKTPLNFIRFLISRITIPQADAVRVVSRRIADSVLRSYRKPPRVEVLPVWTSIDRPAEGVFVDLHKKYKQFDFIVLAVGRLEREKNFPLLLRAFQMALTIIPKSGLVIVGDGRKRKKLEKLAEELGIRETVRFEGWQKNMTAYYNSADLYISSSNYEGYGLSILEAAAHGLPVISTDVGIMGDVLVDNVSGLICPVGDAECLSMKMAELRRFVDVRTRIEKAGKVAARAALWDKENYLKKYLKLWKDCLN